MTTKLESDLSQIVLSANNFSKVIEDKDLRKVAFDRLLEYLLFGERSLQTDFPKKRKLSNSKPDKTDRTAPKPGPKKWIDELIEDGLFSKPLTNGRIRTLLNERGHILKATDITKPLASLVTDKKLRRMKLISEKSKKEQVHWVNW